MFARVFKHSRRFIDIVIIPVPVLQPQAQFPSTTAMRAASRDYFFNYSKTDNRASRSFINVNANGKFLMARVASDH